MQMMDSKGIQFYTDAEQLPVRRFYKFNKYCMISADVGSTISDYDMRMKRAIMYLNNDDISNAKKELTNHRQTFYNAMQEYSPEGCALACLVRSIDDKVYPARLTGDDIDEILNKLSDKGYSIGELTKDVDDVKKKSKANSNSISLASLVGRKLWQMVTRKRS